MSTLLIILVSVWLIVGLILGLFFGGGSIRWKITFGWPLFALWVIIWTLGGQKGMR